MFMLKISYKQRVMLVYELTFLLIVGENQVESIAGVISDVTTVMNFANDALSVMKGETPLEDLILDSTGKSLDTIIEKIDNLTRAMNDMEANNERRMEHMLETIITRIPQENKVNTGLIEFHHYIVRIDEMYEDFQHYRNNLREFSNSTIRSFIDFSFITYDHRKMSLDELDAPVGYIITGVRLEHESNDSRHYRLIAPMQLAICLTKFNFTNGNLCNDDQCSYWMSQENMPSRPEYYTSQRTLLDLSNSDNAAIVKKPIRVTGKSYYVQFDSSNRKKDVGQSTTPFFDAQQISPSTSSPLSGLGLVHRGAEGSGGVLTFRLITLDFSHYLITELPSSIIDELQSAITL